MQMTVGRAVSILVATSLMCLISGIAVRKVQATDPAEVWLMNSSPAALNGLTSKDPAAEQFVVQIRNLNYYYGQGELCTQVLHNINLDLRKAIVL